ncbi:ABC transporter [Novosphingobium sp. PC22D]|uniref:ABC-type transport auxiliary lipoprotein family protein n=1 Tax=Novosphingobium sp. PC22D TaxID=1962403 RepID=UPI000BF17B04|nr:ABC-type transport auxiliary lipoprotein family protein [Novosphingobium sp. PC22D]PEQ13939.1 ABC transporter [Novosphingobium sp. PC22D]
MRASRRLRGAAFAMAASLALSGCLGLGGKTPDQLISLTPRLSADPGATSSGKMSDAIVVLNPDTDRSLDMLRVPVRVDAATIAYLKDVAWVEKPARQFRALLAETLRAKTGRIVVEGGDFEVAGQTMVGGRLLKMGYDAPSQSVVVSFEAMRSNADGSVSTRRFEKTIPGIPPEAVGVAPALNRAANDVAEEVAEWVKG